MKFNKEGMTTPVAKLTTRSQSVKAVPRPSEFTGRHNPNCQDNPDLDAPPAASVALMDKNIAFQKDCRCDRPGRDMILTSLDLSPEPLNSVFAASGLLAEALEQEERVQARHQPGHHVAD